MVIKYKWIGKHTIKPMKDRVRMTKVKAYRIYIGSTVWKQLARRKDQKPIEFTNWKQAEAFLNDFKRRFPKAKAYASAKY